MLQVEMAIECTRSYIKAKVNKELGFVAEVAGRRAGAGPQGLRQRQASGVFLLLGSFTTAGQL